MLRHPLVAANCMMLSPAMVIAEKLENATPVTLSEANDRNSA
jgi:hypothetical protein